MLRRIHCGQLAQWLLLWRSLRHPGYDAAAVLADMRALNVTPHIAQNISDDVPRSTAVPHDMPAMR